MENTNHSPAGHLAKAEEFAARAARELTHDGRSSLAALGALHAQIATVKANFQMTLEVMS